MNTVKKKIIGEVVPGYFNKKKEKKKRKEDFSSA